MKLYVYVEGPADVAALGALWENWRQRLRVARHGMEINHLENKSKFFRKIGYRAAEKLVARETDLVVGLPDLYPNREYENTEYKHDNLSDLIQVQRRLVGEALTTVYQIRKDKVDDYLARFYPCALKHDLEMLLLASVEQLRKKLKTDEHLEGNWRRPVEDQNQNDPPKYVVERLFKTKVGSRYRDTKDAPAILRNVKDMKYILYFGNNQQVTCPVFKAMIDWIAEKTEVPAY